MQYVQRVNLSVQVKAYLTGIVGIIESNVEPKIDVEDPNADELDEPKGDGEVLDPNAVIDAPSMEVVADEVGPKGLEVDKTPKGKELWAVAEDGAKPVVPKDGVFGANGLEDVEDQNGFKDD
ncbi:hypothetical protein U1Q18_026546 [Sarracenia purpurea var. burkii]